MSEYESLNEQLVLHFDELKSQRNGQELHLIEHDLANSAIEELYSLVGGTLRLRSLESKFWKKSPIPLLVAATEVAYGYKGNGTEYWPLLGESLGYHFSIVERNVLRDLFESFQIQFDGAAPPDTEWSRNFSIICWPIANSILPLDMRLPFAEAMAASRFNIASQENDQILKRLRSIRVSFSSTRYRHWLATGTIAADLARYFLNAERPFSIFPATLNRIENDMVADREVRLALRNARRRQSRVAAKRGKRVDKKEVGRKVFGKLQLREFEGRYRLEGVVPMFVGEQSGREWLERNSRNRRWQPKPWGLESAPGLTPSELLFGTPFIVPVRKLFNSPEPPESFFTDDDLANLPKEVFSWSRSLAFNLDLPAVYKLCGEKLYQRSSSRTISSPRGQLIVFRADQCLDLPSGITDVGSLGSLRVLQANVESADASKWLETFGIRVGSAITTSFISPPKFNASAGGLDLFLTGELIGFSIANLNPDTENLTAAIERDGKVVSNQKIDQSGIYIVDTSVSGSLKVTLRDQTSHVVDSQEFQIVQDIEDAIEREVCEFRLKAVSNTTVDLMSESVSVDINSVRELTGLAIEIGLSTEDGLAILEHQSLPIKIGVNHPVWHRLLSDKTRRCISRGGDVTLTVGVVGVGEKSWLLENDSPSVWWSLNDGEEPTPKAENSVYSSHRVPLSSNSLIPDCPTESDVQLLVPSENGEPKYELPCLVWCPKESSFPPMPHRPVRMPRRMESIDGHFGMKEWVKKYIALSSAKSPHSIAALNRERFKQSYFDCINEVLSGKNWASKQIKEEKLLSRQSPLQTLLESARQNQAGFVELESKLMLGDLLTSELLAHIATVLPVYWWKFPIVEFTDSQGEQLDLAFQDAYLAVAEAIAEEKPEFAAELRGVSPFTETTVWQETLLAACERLNGSALASFIVPLDGGDSLVQMPTDELGVDDMAQIIFDWRSEFLPSHSASIKWTVERLRTAFCLYLCPSYLRKTDWESVIEALITDRVTSRAVSFLAWKKTHLERLDEL